MTTLDNVLIYGGTFNPIHNGHIQLAEKARRQTHCDKVIFIPSYSPYLGKTNGDTNATYQDRFEMTKFAIKDNPNFEISDIEFQMKRKKSYTLDVIRELKKIAGEAFANVSEKVKLLIGADAFETLDKWNRIDELAKEAKFVVVTRPGVEPLSEIKKRLKTDNIEYEEVRENLDISSTAIRNKVKSGENISGFAPKAVEDYIKEHKLYIEA